MRNLKRALSLALALVMVLSMMVVGASAVSADDFSDSADIVNKEAVTVLATLGVITGNDDGSYDPTGTITRAEMATIICRVLNGGSDPVLGESVTDSYTDTASHWAKAYIEYCTTLGIVSGKGDGTFDPDGEVTVAEAAKMVLVALGYNASIESYTGANWQINVDARANPLGLYDDMSYSNTSAALTRDNAAQMLYNALDCDEVEYEYVLDTTNGSLTGSSQLKSDSTLGTLLEEEFDAVKVEGIVVANEVANLETSGSLDTGRTRILVTNYEDQEYYGAAANDDGIYTRTVDFSTTTSMDELGRAVYFYVEKASTSTNAEVLGSVIISEENRVVTSYSADPFVDIADDNNLDLVTSGDEATQVARDYGNAEDIDDSDDEYDTKTVKGTEKIFIDNDDDSEVEYIIVNTYRFGKVTSYVSSGSGSITVNYGTDGTFTADDADDVVGFEDVSRDDYVIAIEVGGDLYVELADTITGSMDGYDTTTDIEGDEKIGQLTVDDEDYDVSLVGGYTGGSDDIQAAQEYGEEYLDSEATFYLTKGGLIAAAGEGDGSAYKYALVLATGSSGLEDRVRVALSDGSTGTYTVDDNSEVDETEAEIGMVYRYTLDSSDEIRLTEIDSENQDSLTDATFEQDRTAIRGDGDSRDTYYATSSTAFFYVGVDDIHDYGEEERIDTDDVDIYTGYQQAPDLDDSDIYADIYVRGDSDSTQVGAVVFYGSANLASADMDDSLYITDIIRRRTDYTVVEAYVAGETELQELNIDSGEEPDAGSVYTYTINSDGYYELDTLTVGESGVDGKFEVETASSSTFVSEDGEEYVITSETLLVDDSDYLDAPTAELGAGPYEGDYIAWVTYNSDNEAILVVIDNDDSSSGSSGGSSSSDSDTADTGETYEAEGSVNSRNRAVVSFDFDRAAYAATGSTATISFDVYVNGDYDTTETVTTNGSTARWTSGDNYYEEDDEITVDNVEITYSAVNVLYVLDEDDTTSTAARYLTASTATLSSGTNGGTISFTVSGNYASADVNYTVTGVTTSNADGEATPGTAESFTAVASGDGYVKVVLSDLSDATATYTVTGFSDTLPNLYDYDSTIGSGRTFTATVTSTSVSGGETVGVVISVDQGLLTTTEGGLIVTFDIGGTERSMTLLNDGQTPDDIVLEVTVNEDIEIAVVDVEILDAPTVTSVEVTESSYDADDVLTAGSFPDSITLNFSAPVEDAPALTGGTVQFGEGELSDDGMSATYTVTTNGADTDGFSIAASEIVGENGVINVTATSFTVDGETVTVND